MAPNEMTLGRWLADWLRLYARQNVRQRTYERYVSLAGHCDMISEYKIQELRPSHFLELYQTLSEFSGETRKKVHNLLNQALNQAVNDKIIHSTPMDSVKAPKVVREEIETFTKEQLKAVLDAAKDRRYYAAILLGATTGMRLGEVLGLRWQDVDFDEDCVHVRQSLQHSSTGIIFEDPKSKTSKRKISIPLPTLAALRKQKKDIMSMDILATDLCFPATNGSPTQPRNFLREWTKVQQLASPDWLKLEKQRVEMRKEFGKESDKYKQVEEKQKALEKSIHKNFHVLRHTHATFLLASGEPVIDVSRRLGHSKPSITLDIYGHAIPGHDKKLADKISSLYGL